MSGIAPWLHDVASVLVLSLSFGSIILNTDFHSQGHLMFGKSYCSSVAMAAF
jgi:hypothetical protein